MKKFLTTIFIIAITLSVKSQIDTIFIYNTYNDFQNKTGVRMNKYRGFYNSMNKITLQFRDEKNKKKKFKCKKIWGYSYNGALFRVDKRCSQPARVISVGKICYYENGPANMEMIENHSTEGSFRLGYFCYVSKDLNSEMIPFPGQKPSDAWRMVEKFFGNNPQYSPIFNCLSQNYSYQNVRECVASHDK